MALCEAMAAKLRPADIQTYDIDWYPKEPDGSVWAEEPIVLVIYCQNTGKKTGTANIVVKINGFIFQTIPITLARDATGYVETSPFIPNAETTYNVCTEP